MKQYTRHLVGLSAALAATLGGCSDDGESNDSPTTTGGWGTGSATGTGSSAPIGGAGTGGTTSTGGVIGSGSTGTGGATSSGGSGGGAATGGADATGGAAPTGGRSVTGGTGNLGGNPETGGAATGGMTTGGTLTGGAPTGGAATGGSSTGGAATGGSPTGGAGTGGSTATTPVGRHGQLRVVGNQLRDASDQPVMLRGQGFGWDNWWPQYYNADVVAWLRDDWCVDMVRPAMGIEPEGAYLENPSASRGRIQAVVDAAIAEEIYVIIDWHAHDLHQSEAVAFFSDMAQTYGDQPNVIYEIFNEPDDESWPQIKAYAETVISAIRQHDPDNVVIVGCPEWDQRIDEVVADPITSDDNVVYAVHFYAATHGQWLRDRTADAIGSGIPVFVSESSGSEADGLGGNDYDEWQAWFDFMDANQVSWINYSVSDKAGETISVLEPGASAAGGWDSSQLTESGEYVRDVFRGYCD